MSEQTARILTIKSSIVRTDLVVPSRSTLSLTSSIFPFGASCLVGKHVISVSLLRPDFAPGIFQSHNWSIINMLCSGDAETLGLDQVDILGTLWFQRDTTCVRSLYVVSPIM